MNNRPTTKQLEAAELFHATDPQEGRGMVVPMSDSGTLLDVIRQAASNPAVDVAKMERLMDLYERRQSIDARTAYYAALVEMKPQLPIIDRRGKIVITDKNDRQKVIQSTPYALYEDIDEAITPILHEYGFVITFRSGMATDGKVTVMGVLTHNQGHSEETTITLPHDSTGSKNAVQAIGSSTSYGKRMAATLLLNIRTKGEDDDGKRGGDEGLLTDDQVEKVFDLINRFGVDKDAFCKYLGVASVPDIPSNQYERAITALNLKEKKVQK